MDQIMLKEYIVQKEEYKAKIIVGILHFSLSDLTYRISDLEILPKGKRKWISIGTDIRDEYAYRVLDFDGRSQYAKEQYLKYVSWEDLCAAVDHAYAQLKPDYEHVDFRIL